MARRKAQKLDNKPQDYETQKRYWYRKLARSGFHDIEREGPKYKVEAHTARFNTEAVARSWHAKTEYYSMAGQFLNNYKFASRLEKIIWEYHTNGISARNIAKLLKKVKIIKPNKDNISTIIKRLIIEMKKLYLPGYKS